jgi:hypothetical protein
MPLDARPLHELSLSEKKISLAILFLFRERRKRTLLSRFALLQSSCLPVLVGA